MKESGLNIVDGLHICNACIDGVDGECHTPGCVFWLSTTNDLPKREMILLTGGTIRRVSEAEHSAGDNNTATATPKLLEELDSIVDLNMPGMRDGYRAVEIIAQLRNA